METRPKGFSGSTQPPAAIFFRAAVRDRGVSLFTTRIATSYFSIDRSGPFSNKQTTLSLLPLVLKRGPFSFEINVSTSGESLVARSLVSYIATLSLFYAKEKEREKERYLESVAEEREKRIKRKRIRSILSTENER